MSVAKVFSQSELVPVKKQVPVALHVLEQNLKIIFQCMVTCWLRCMVIFGPSWKLKVKVVQTLCKVVYPLDVWKHGVPNSITISGI